MSDREDDGPEPDLEPEPDFDEDDAGVEEGVLVVGFIGGVSSFSLGWL